MKESQTENKSPHLQRSGLGSACQLKRKLGKEWGMGENKVKGQEKRNQRKVDLRSLSLGFWLFPPHPKAQTTRCSDKVCGQGLETQGGGGGTSEEGRWKSPQAMPVSPSSIAQRPVSSYFLISQFRIHTVPLEQQQKLKALIR